LGRGAALNEMISVIASLIEEFYLHILLLQETGIQDSNDRHQTFIKNRLSFLTKREIKCFWHFGVESFRTKDEGNPKTLESKSGGLAIILMGIAAKLRSQVVQTSKNGSGIVMIAVKVFRNNLPINILNFYSPHPIDYNGKRTGGMADRIFGGHISWNQTKKC